MSETDDWYKAYATLANAVRELYFATHWTAGQPIDNEAELWEKVRDAAGMLPPKHRGAGG